MKPCEYCGTELDDDGTEESTIPSAGSRITHFAGVCRERVYAALRGERANNVALAQANARARSDLVTEIARLEGALSVASKAVAEEARLRGVLEWYATGYGTHPEGHCGDYGKRARDALANLPHSKARP